MGARITAKTLALMDRCVAALEQGPAEAKEVAARIGTVPCYCTRPSAVGVDWPHGLCADNPGWMKANMGDVRPALEHAVRRGLIGRDKTEWGTVIYSRVSLLDELPIIDDDLLKYATPEELDEIEAVYRAALDEQRRRHPHE